MKVFLSLIILFTFTLSARAAEDYCKGKSTCLKGHVPFLKSGTYFAKGEGRTCNEAKEESQSMFMHQYGDMDCGLIASPYVWSCSKVATDHYVAWTKCNPDSGIKERRSSSNCAVVGGKILCNR